MISLIVGMAHNRVIGKQNQLPWHLPADLIWFKKTTMGKPIVMGRKTHESIGKALPGRQNVIISRNRKLSYDDCDVVHSPEQAISLLKDEDEIMIIGGALVYEQFLPLAERLYLTQVDADVEGDAFFPDYETKADWKRVFKEDHLADERHAYNYSFQQLNRVK
jgi:dihydrofolate reductase